MNKYSDKLVLRVNEIYHDIEGSDCYDHSHDEIFALEPERWHKMFEKYFGHFWSGDGRCILDVGSGTGFVPSTIGKYLRPEDKMVCGDISQKMLDQCSNNVAKHNFVGQFEYRKYDGINLPAKDKSIDLVTVNSVLHHIPDTMGFLKEADRILKPGGFLVIAHEPSTRFYKNKLIWTVYRVLYLLYHPRAIKDSLARRGFKLNKALEESPRSDSILESINRAILQEGLADAALSRRQLNDIVEVHSISGFDIDDLKRSLPHFEQAHYETYNHLYWIYMEHYKNPIIKFIDWILGKMYPKDGKTIMVIFKKLDSL
ncbi:MAG: methyltransferase domain-containing protein [bacterium]|nr:methyltransferase domain-containing protein [bacterium]